MHDFHSAFSNFHLNYLNEPIPPSLCHYTPHHLSESILNKKSIRAYEILKQGKDSTEFKRGIDLFSKYLSQQETLPLELKNLLPFSISELFLKLTSRYFISCFTKSTNSNYHFSNFSTPKTGSPFFLKFDNYFVIPEHYKTYVDNIQLISVYSGEVIYCENKQLANYKVSLDDYLRQRNFIITMLQEKFHRQAISDLLLGLFQVLICSCSLYKEYNFHPEEEYRIILMTAGESNKRVKSDQNRDYVEILNNNITKILFYNIKFLFFLSAPSATYLP